MTTDFRALCAELLAALEIQLDELRFNNRLCIRARALLAQPTPQPSVAIAEMVKRLHEINNPTPQPVAVSERLPGPEDCDEQGRCWWKFEGTDDYEPCWTLRKMHGIPFSSTRFLPANALPNPELANAQ